MKKNSVAVQFILALGLPVLLFAADIIELHRNFSDGRPSSLNRTVTVTGVVTVPTGVLSTTSLELVIQDSTAGIHLYSLKPGPQPFALGDLLRVTGTVAYLYGRTSIKDPTELTLLAQNQPLPDPRPLTCAQVNATFKADRSEPDESRLIRLSRVVITGVAGDTYTIADSSGATSLYRDPDARLPELPAGPFDVTGILQQYDRSVTPPIKSGYQIIPRFASDIISHAAPMLLEPLQESAIAARQVELSWRTDRPATSLVRFGTNPYLWSGASGDSLPSAEHRVTLSSLEPATLYYAMAWSSDSTGTIASDTLLFMTASDRSSGTIEAYFSRSVDARKAWLEVARGNTDLSQIIVQRVRAARYSIDFHYYSFTHADIAMALVEAKRRGVSVRAIFDDETMTAGNDKIAWLRDAGIPLISDRFGANDGSGASHNKFVIIDHRDHSSGLDDYLWTGSANASYAGSTSNAENMLLIQDESLCAAYTIEFNEMWGSASEQPDPERSRFGARKRDNTPHRFNIGGRPVEQYMSPSDHTEERIIAAIGTAHHSLYFAILAFTQASIATAMQERRVSIPGLVVRGVFDRSSSSSSLSEYAVMAGSGAGAWSPPADVHLDAVSGDLHHKYLLIDANAAGSDPTLVTGSHNWSSSANSINDECTLIIHDRHLVNLYSQEFSARYREAGGTGEIISGVQTEQVAEQSPRQWRLGQNYPNPFNNSTLLPIETPASGEALPEIMVYDISGRMVRRLKPVATAGVYWDGRDQDGRDLPSGLYFARWDAAKQPAIKMLLVR